jgi:hypothetical protein
MGGGRWRSISKTPIREDKNQHYLIKEMTTTDLHLSKKNADKSMCMEILDMREKTLEQKLIAAVKSKGGICPKFTSPGTDGMPDRIAILPGGKVAFVEVKRPGEKPRPLQAARHEMLRRLGVKVFVLDDANQIERIIREIQSA